MYCQHPSSIWDSNNLTIAWKPSKSILHHVLKEVLKVPKKYLSN